VNKTRFTIALRCISLTGRPVIFAQGKKAGCSGAGVTRARQAYFDAIEEVDRSPSSAPGIG